MLVVPAVLLAAALPAQARAGMFSGIVVAKQPQRGTLLLAHAHGVGLTVRGWLAPARVGERVAVRGVRLNDGTVRASRLHVLSRVRAATLRGTVIRWLARGTLLSSGRSVVMIHRPARGLSSAWDHGGLRPGDVAQFQLRFDHGELVEAAPPVQVGQVATTRIEGTIVSVSPFVVSAEGLPLTITIPSETTLPAGLAAGQRIELTVQVQVGGGNTFTLVAIDEVENENPAVPAREVEVKGLVVSSTATHLVVNSNGSMFTFAAPNGTTLPVLAPGTSVEIRGVQQNGAIILERLRIEGNDDGDGHDDGGGGGGGDSGGSGEGDH